MDSDHLLKREPSRKGVDVEERTSRWPPLLSFAAACVCFLIGVALIPAGIDDRDVANASLTFFGVGVALLILTAIFAIRWQVPEARFQDSAIDAWYPMWRAVTVATWIFVVPNILFLTVFALLATQVGALEDRDEAWDILIPQAVTAAILVTTLVWLAPWRVPLHAKVWRRFGFLVPIVIVVTYWWWQYQ